jgi:hypothetical protein
MTHYCILHPDVGEGMTAATWLAIREPCCVPAPRIRG